MSPRLHFGLGADSVVDSLRVVWPSRKQQVLKNPKTDQTLTLRETDATGPYRAPGAVKPFFAEIPPPIAHAFPTNAVNDFKRQPLLVSPLSFSTPCLAKADVNGDGREDVNAGGSGGQAGTLFIQQPNGSFSRKNNPVFSADQSCEDTDAVFFDANGDGYADLYAGSGGYGDLLPDDARLQDRLYLNDGKGNFRKASLPALRTSTGCVVAGDFKGDGKFDMFVGGRVVPGHYPETPRSYLLVNDGKGNFTDQTARLAPRPRTHRAGGTACSWTTSTATVAPIWWWATTASTPSAGLATPSPPNWFSRTSTTTAASTQLSASTPKAKVTRT